jgi:hypothetical protein
LTIGAVVYVRSHPLVFMNAHEHCIKLAALELHQYASEHQGRFPFDPRGYGDALLLMLEECFHSLTGPGYDAAPLRDARRAGGELAEEECGRVYVQGLTQKSKPEIVLLFDKLPTPGGDHCHFPARVWAPLGREVCFVDGSTQFVSESDWSDFAGRQADLLVQEGFDRREAERLFNSPHR